MIKRVFATADIERLNSEGQTTLQLEPGDTVTPLARDTAVELGITIYEPGQAVPAAAPEGGPTTMDEKSIEAIVQAVLAQVEGKLGVCAPCATPRVYGSRPGEVQLFKIPKNQELDPLELRDEEGNLVNPPEIDFRLKDVVTVDAGSSMGVGYMSWREGGFNWTLNYDEVDLVVEGVMEITCKDKKVVAYPGDVVFIPNGSSIRWSTPSWVKVMYVTFPAEWAG
jgi:ethanolamine utilization protein EutQ